MRILRYLTASVLFALVTAAVVGCGDRETPHRPDTQIDPSRGPAQPAPIGADFELVSCVDSIAGTARVVEVAAIVPPDMVRQPRPHYQGWTPAALADLAVAGSRAVVLDGQSGLVTVFEPGFQARLTFGGRGDGPGEFQHAVAVALADGRSEIVVLDQNPPRVGVFDLQGQHLRTVQIPDGGFPLDVAVDDGGRFLISHRLVHFALNREGARGTLVGIHAPDGEQVGHMADVTTDDLELPRFPLPGYTDVRVNAARGRLAIFYPAAGHVDVYRNGVHEAAVTTCIPGQVRDAYARQRESQGMFGTSGQQTPMEIISDVHLGADGSIHTIGPFATGDGWYHIDHFAQDGTSLGSTVFPTRDVRLPRRVRFGGSQYEIYGFDERGAVGQFRVDLDEGGG